MLHAVKGMNDIMPNASETFLDSYVWEYLQKQFELVLSRFAYKRVILPVVEETEVFARGLGENTDIVSKEMYCFEDRGGRRLTLRPEGTAGAVRAYVEHSLGQVQPIQRWWYMGPMYRAERPQKGRYRQFYQVGAEVFGIASAECDVEMLQMLVMLCQNIGIHDVTLRLNTLGDSESRQHYRSQLQTFLQAFYDKLCESCQHRLQHNPLRVLDCKRDTCRDICKNAPDMLHSLTPVAQEHFARVLYLLDALHIPYVRDAKLVRGLDYYTGIIFECTTQHLGSQDAILGGGRYDALVEQFGGPATSAIGFAAGIERLALLVAEGVLKKMPPLHLYVIPATFETAEILSLATALRNHPHACHVEVDTTHSNIKTALRRAVRQQALAVLVLGDDERKTQRAKIKHLSTGKEIEVVLDASAISSVVHQLAREGE